MNKCGLLSLLFVASSIVSCVVFSDYSSAAYEGVYRTTDSLVLEANDYGGVDCSLIDTADNWYTRALDAPTNAGGWKEELQTAYTSGDYIVSQYTSQSGGGYYKGYVIIFSNEGGMGLWFDSTAVYTTGTTSNTFIGSVLLAPERAITGSGDCETLYVYHNTLFAVSGDLYTSDSVEAFIVNIDPNNVEYPPNYTGDPIENIGGGGSGSYDPNPNACSTLDVGCWISSAFDRVVDGFESFWEGTVALFEGVMQFIGNIFVPSDDNMLIGFFDQILESLNNKLSVFLYPFEFLAEWFNSMIFIGGFSVVDCEDANASPWFCYYEVENAMFGASFVINIGQTERLVKDVGLYTLVVTFGRAVGAIMVIMLANRAYMKITNQHEEVEA